MANRSVVVRLLAQVGSYVSDMGRAEQSTERLGTAQDRAGKSTDRVSDSARRAAAALAQEAAQAQAAANAAGLHYNAQGKLVDAQGKFVSQSAAAAAGVAHFSDAVKQASANSDQAASGFDRLAASAEKNRDSWDKAGAALAGAGVGIVAALGASAKAAMSWESAWAGVTKTVDGSPEQMAALEQGLRGLAKTLPITHEEIAGVAEAAGQLGVKRQDILGFTKTMVDLGVSTNLTAEEAATSIAQISNVMGTMSREGAEGVSRFAATLVGLGNDGASTEAEILAMAQRIAGAGATVGATEVEVLALSNTLASMGIQAELGGGVTTRVLLKMYSAVQQGGKGLEAFARTAGMSAKEFSDAFKSSPVEAMNLVAQGLARVKDEGGNVVAAMEDMGIKGTQETQVMLSLANSGDLLADSLASGAVLWEENTAAVEEATKRYETADSKVKVAWNNIKDAAISAGSVLLPMIASVADSVADLASWFGNLPAPVQSAMTIMGGLVGTAALLAGGFLVLFPRVMDTVKAFQTLGITGGAAGGKLKTLGKALGIAGIALAAAAALVTFRNSMEPAVASTEEMTQALIGLKKNKNAINDVFANIDPGAGGAILKDIDSIGEAMVRIQGNGFRDWFGKLGDSIGVDNDITKMNGAISNLDASLAGMVGSGNLENASEGFRAVAASAKEHGMGLDEVSALMPNYINSLREAANAAGVHVEEADLLNWAMGKTPPAMLEAASATDEATASAESQAAAAEEAAAANEEYIAAMEELGLSTDGTITSLDKFVDALIGAGLATMSSREAAFGWQETLRGIDEQIAGVVNSQGELGSVLNATGTDFNMMTDAGKAANEVFQGVVTSGLGVATAFSKDLSKSAADVSQQLHSTYDAALDTARGFSVSEEAAVALTREVLQIPPGVDINTWMDDEAMRMSGNTKDSVEAIPDSVRVNTSMDDAAFKTAGMTKQAADDIPEQETIDSWMSDAAFIEAIRTRAAAEGIPPDVAVDSFMSSAARNEADDTTSRILKIPKGASITSYMDAYARREAEQLAAQLNAIDGKTVNTYTNHHTTWIESKVYQEGTQMPGRGGSSPRAAKGARLTEFFGLNGLASGGRVPGARSANPLVDNVLAMVNGKPLGLQGTEWVINPKSSDDYNKELAAINAGSFPKGVLDGGLGGGAGREWSGQLLVGAGGAGSGSVERHYHTHVSSAPGMEQSYAQTIADKAVQRQRDIQLAYNLNH